MAKYNKKVVADICDLLAKDSYTIDEICMKVGISRSTYFDWQRTKPDFLDSIKKARISYSDLMVSEAKKSLMKRLRGYDYEETKTIVVNGKDNKPTIREQTKTKRHVPADMTAVIFALTNKAPDEFKHRQELTGKISLEQKLNTLSDSQLSDVIDSVLNSQPHGSE